MRRLIRNTGIWLAAGAILAAGMAAFCLVDLARTGSGNYPDRLLSVEGARAELMGEEILLPELPPRVREAACAATALIPPEWRLLFKTALRAVQEGLDNGETVDVDTAAEGVDTAAGDAEASAASGETGTKEP